MSGPILSLDAEQSCTLINETLSAHDDAIDASPRTQYVGDDYHRQQVLTGLRFSGKRP